MEGSQVQVRSEERGTAEAPRVVVKREAEVRASWVPFLLSLSVGLACLLAAALAPEERFTHGGYFPQPEWVAWVRSLGLGCLLLAFPIYPALLVARAARAEADRLRTALACPYCRDGIQTPEAMACARPGCGALYHAECWREVRPTYGGCAIYGCGSTAAHPVGRFAIQRRIWRLVVAAAFFPPTAVRRLRQTDPRTFRDLWAEARTYQRGVSEDARRSLAVGALDALLVVPPCTAAVIAIVEDPGRVGLAASSIELVGLVVLLVFLLGAASSVALMRLPLVAMFGGGVARLVARMFREELAALGRADEGTFLARLAGGLGKAGKQGE